MRLAALLLVCAVITANGCGYYSTTGRTAGEIKTVHIPFFDNRTAEPNLEIDVTEQVINFIVADNTLKVVNTAEEADAVLEGSITTFRRTPFSFNQDLNAEEYRLLVVVQATLFNQSKNEPVWAGEVLKGDASFFLEAVEGGFSYEEAIEIAIQQITERILNLTVRDW